MPLPSSPPPLSLSTQLIVVHTDCVSYHLAFHVVRFASLLRAVSLLFDELLCLSTLCCRGMFVHWCPYCCFHFGMERCSYSRITFCFDLFWLGNIALSVIRPGCFSIRFSVKMITITFAARAGRLTVFGHVVHHGWCMRNANWYRLCLKYIFEHEFKSCVMFLGPDGHTSECGPAGFRLIVFRVNPSAWLCVVEWRNSALPFYRVHGWLCLRLPLMLLLL